jgi:hypothetical protein
MRVRRRGVYSGPRHLDSEVELVVRHGNDDVKSGVVSALPVEDWKFLK